MRTEKITTNLIIITKLRIFHREAVSASHQSESASSPSPVTNDTKLLSLIPAASGAIRQRMRRAPKKIKIKQTHSRHTHVCRMWREKCHFDKSDRSMRVSGKQMHGEKKKTTARTVIKGLEGYGHCRGGTRSGIEGGGFWGLRIGRPQRQTKFDARVSAT